MRWLTRRPPRAAPKDRYRGLSAALNDALAELARTTEPASRAALLIDIGDRFTELASLEVPAHGGRAHAAALTLIDNANFARVLADAEDARARRAPRPRTRPDLEWHAGALLDQLADPAVGDSARADIYAVLQAVTRQVCSGASPAPLLAELQHWHAHQAGRPGYGP